MFSNRSILITGGTGSFGKTFAKLTLEKFSPKSLVIFSRDEMKQWQMAEQVEKLGHKKIIEFVIGDVRDKERLNRVMQGVDFVVHAAATKIVPTAEYNPNECIKTNVIGAMNLVDVAIDNDIEKVVALSTDKACNPVNLYGATKLASDKLFVAANLHSQRGRSVFSVVRYGNVMGSRGSVIPFFQEQAKSGSLPITDKRMTRFMISIEQGVRLVWHAFNDALGGEIYVHKIPSMRVTEIAEAISPEARQDVIGIRPGEKLHEVMISEEDSLSTYEYDWYYKILPTLKEWHKDKKKIKCGRLVSPGFTYSSENNPEWMTITQLRAFLSSSAYKNLLTSNI